MNEADRPASFGSSLDISHHLAHGKLCGKNDLAVRSNLVKCSFRIRPQGDRSDETGLDAALLEQLTCLGAQSGHCAERNKYDLRVLKALIAPADQFLLSLVIFLEQMLDVIFKDLRLKTE